MEPAIMYARSRSRVATTLLLTAPGIPMLFMGQEIIEDKPWHIDIRFWSQFMIWWDGLSVDRSMRDFLRFTQDLIQLHRRYLALCGEGIRVLQVHNHDRIIVVHRWLEGEGRDLLVVASLNETTLDGYPVALPWPDRRQEVFNSDVYDHFPNPWVTGNGGSVFAEDSAGKQYPFSDSATCGVSFREAVDGQDISEQIGGSGLAI